MNIKRKILGVFLVILSVLFLGSCVSEEEYIQKSQENDKLYFQLAELKYEHGKLLGEKSQLEAAKRDLELANANQGKKIDELNQDNSELQKILAARSDSLSKTIVSLRSDIDDLKNENTGQKAQLAERNMEIEKLLKEINSLNERNKALQDQAAELERQKQQEMANMKGTYEDLLQDMKSEIDKGKITITQLEGKLKVNMLDEILFDSGKVTIKPEGIEVLERVGNILVNVKDRSINIEGHTDNVPIGAELAKIYPTNWELSAARASNVARYLQEKAGISPELLSATGYGEYQPVASNDTTEGKAKNRRIEIVLVPREITPIAR
ncbi:MAG: OmpA family protein [Deltaproteobacteria bacterium]|nr:OmpA family protein [Deltaproteobacteria bacterium]